MRTIPVVNSLLSPAYATKTDDALTPLRVQKLMYYVHGWYLAITGQSVLDEPFIAGKYGPELLSLRGTLGAYRNVPVDDYLPELDIEAGKLSHFFVNAAAFPQFERIVKRVFDTYRQLTTAQLSTMGHADGSPWARTPQGRPIDNAFIREDFVQRAWENEQRNR